MIQLPSIHGQVMAEDMVNELLRDWQLLCEIREVKLRRQGNRRAESGAPSLGEAVAAWHSGEAVGLQVCYDYQGQQWVDTLLKQGSQAQLFRMSTSEAERLREEDSVAT